MPQNDQSLDNPIRLRALSRFFGLSAGAIARSAGVSKSYVARVLAPNDGFEGSSAFRLKLESSLAEIVRQREMRVFAVDATTAESAQELEEASGLINRNEPSV